MNKKLVIAAAVMIIVAAVFGYRKHHMARSLPPQTPGVPVNKGVIVTQTSPGEAGVVSNAPAQMPATQLHSSSLDRSMDTINQVNRVNQLNQQQQAPKNSQDQPAAAK
jgi:hypothetical protein